MLPISLSFSCSISELAHSSDISVQAAGQLYHDDAKLECREGRWFWYVWDQDLMFPQPVH